MKVPDYNKALAKAILVYDYKYEQVQRAGDSVHEQKCKEAWDAIVELARELANPASKRAEQP